MPEGNPITDRIIEAYVYFRERKFKVAEYEQTLSRNIAPIHHIGEESPFMFMRGQVYQSTILKMQDEQLCNAIGDVSFGEPMKATLDVRGNDWSMRLSDTDITEYFGRKVTLMGGLLTSGQDLIEIHYTKDLSHIKLIEEVEKKDPSIKRFRLILDLEDN